MTFFNISIENYKERNIEKQSGNLELELVRIKDYVEEMKKARDRYLKIQNRKIDLFGSFRH